MGKTRSICSTLEPINMQCLDANHKHPKLTFGLCRGKKKRDLWSEADGKFYLRRSLHGNYCAVDQFSIQTQGRRALFMRPFNRRLDWTNQGSHPEDAISPPPSCSVYIVHLAQGDSCWTRFKWWSILSIRMSSAHMIMAQPWESLPSVGTD